MNCPSCGAECAAGTRYCWSCGQPLQTPSEERRVVTVLFADLVGFTALSEQLDPEHLKRLVDQGFERLVRDVTAFGGRVDKIIGDAIVALFGAPVAHEDDAERAVRAALRMQETLGTYAEERGARIRMRIGVNTGEVLVGALRAGGDYTAMGDVVNTAARLQTLAEPGEVLVGESTHGATQEVIAYESRGALIARGRERPVNVWAATEALQPPGHRPRHRLSPLIGREREMAILTNAVRVSLSHGRAQMLLVLGEAGVGKTRLANELAAVVEEDGVLHISGRCVPYGEANPWWPIAEGLRAGCGIGREEPLDSARVKTDRAVARVCSDADAAERTAVVNGLLHLMGHEGPLRGLDGAGARTEATQALLTFLEAAVREQPIMVRLADLHWADQAVLDLIDELSVHLARQRFVFVATARRALQERWTPRSGRFNSLVLNLDPLDRDASALLLETLGGEDLGVHERDMLLDRSGGNPFYLEELVTLVGQHHVDVAISSLGERSARAPSLSEALPDTLRGLVAARIDGLSAEEQLVLEDASVWGSSGPMIALNRIAEAVRGMADVTALVQSMADKDVMVLDGSEWSFRSDLVREVAYARLTKKERLLRHLGIATYMEHAVAGRFADDGLVDMVARHFVEAARLARDLGPGPGADDPHELSERAVRWASEAARRAEHSASWPLAERLYSQVLDLLDDVVNLERFRALLGRSRVRAERWDDAGAREDAVSALGLADGMGDPGARAEAHLRLAAASARAGEFDRADAELDDAIELFDGQGDVRGRAEALRQRGMAYLLRGDQRLAEEPIAAALDAFRAVGDRRGEAWSLQNLAWIAFTDGRVDAAERAIDASRQAFEEVGDRGGLAWVEGLSAFVKFQQGDFDSARDLSASILRESERRGDRFGEGMMHVLQAGIELWTGHAVAAVAAADRAVDALRLSGDLVGLEQALAVSGRAHVTAGELHRGTELLDEALAASEGTSAEFARSVADFTAVQLGRPDRLLGGGDEYAGSPVSPAQHLAARALALAQMSREEQGLELAVRAVESAPEGAYEWSTMAMVSAACGRRADTEKAAEVVMSLARATYLDRLTAQLALALGDLGADGDRALDAARLELRTGEDVVATAVVALAAATRAEALGITGPGAAEADRLLQAIGLGDTRWRDLFRRAVGHASRPS
jgi:class 3 adenylate cyclase/tetratricopeptide (TPR) repeat protein